ncbi:MAG: indolepyruvate oxidoreductase subunit B [Candidatus Nealsonbacteria bacterium CG02_land_8_20_14_3_00_37_10]|uniref:Indolepyruvate oxidoreductase subunit B n=2 Tax=Candidatus Nealsoniibacteriota TaxID=1817911 RepID=A0A2G9Z0B5_9BACT|nr:MAG: indolepyruvate oxidoreductase subunit B [Candidatus Nealsonbacteria bacterium CG23_combo_of_CG06-09_8_20_14_all_37_18]PIV44861.1 MAG: indolepyruvate oxidoreductase subunit B [Candidatus Nealsonbacteria bacterium CG02_land_8_20_14_3_00_37_10]
MKKTKKDFNIVITGVGGQGLITLLQILAEAVFSEGYEVRTSELHGLSQRGGSVEVHIRFGRKIYSPLISQGKADLILSLEMQEALKAAYFANPKTNFLINEYIVPIPLQKTLSKEVIFKNLKKVSKNINVVPAEKICQEKLENSVVSGVYLLSLAVFKKLIPLKPDSLLKAIKKIIPEKYLELNLKTFELVKKS